MKRSCISLILIAFITFISSLMYADPLLVVVHMIKNEAAVIQATLLPYLKVDPMGKRIAHVIFDTGSTDDTLLKTRELFAQYPLCKFVIGQEPFVNFSVSRNMALRFAEQQFPEAVFLMMPDAEWYINNLEYLLQICESQRNSIYKSFLILIKTIGMDFFLPRIMRARCDLGFKGVVHEYLDTQEISLKLPENIFFEYPDRPQGINKSRERWYRDVKMLFEEHCKNPEDPRTIFYLAQSYDCVGDMQSAAKYYQLRTQFKGFDEEDYMAHFRLGKVVERLASANNAFTWQMALKHYLDAFMLRPSRAEPLIVVAGHYLGAKEYELAFLYAYMACQIPLPSTDILFVEKNFYDHLRYEIFAKAALEVEIQFPRKIYEKANGKNLDVPQERFILTQAFGAV